MLSDRRYVWAGEELIQERNGTTPSTITRRYYPTGVNDNGIVYYTTRDHLGSVREVHTASGALAARYKYDPYGNRTLTAGTYASDVAFAGYFFHAPSGLYLTHYRAYDPRIGRWLSRDPIAEAGGINLYAYVGGEPVGMVDPLGLVADAGWDGFNVGLGLAVAEWDYSRGDHEAYREDMQGVAFDSFAAAVPGLPGGAAAARVAKRAATHVHHLIFRRAGGPVLDEARVEVHQVLWESRSP